MPPLYTHAQITQNALRKVRIVSNPFEQSVWSDKLPVGLRRSLPHPRPHHPRPLAAESKRYDLNLPQTIPLSDFTTDPRYHFERIPDAYGVGDSFYFEFGVTG